MKSNNCNQEKPYEHQELCKGCTVQIRHVCWFVDHKSVPTCPCLMCLVKTICIENCKLREVEINKITLREKKGNPNTWGSGTTNEQKTL